MKLAVISFLALSLLQGISAAPAANVVGRDGDVEKAPVLASPNRPLDSRACPRTTDECAVVASYPPYFSVEVTCYTADNTTPIDGEPRWAQLKAGDWVPIAYLTLYGGTPDQCA